MTTRETTPMTARERGAMAAASTAVTLAVGITLAVLGGHLRAPDPTVDAAAEQPVETVAAPDVTPALSGAGRVILVPIERATAVTMEPLSPPQADSEPESAAGGDLNAWEDDDDDGERRRHHDGERRRRHDDDDEHEHGVIAWDDHEGEGRDG